MGFFLKHDTFKKARRAIFISSIISLALQSGRFTNTKITILETTFEYSASSVIFFSKVLVAYYLSVAMTLVYQHWTHFNPPNFKRKDTVGMPSQDKFGNDNAAKSIKIYNYNMKEYWLVKFDYMHLFVVIYGAPLILSLMAMFGITFDRILNVTSHL